MTALDEIFGHEIEEKPKNNILIIDLSNILHSTFHAQVRFDRSLKDEFEKYAMWRFLILNSILNIKNKFQPDEIVLALDGKSWRKKWFNYYKANRVLARKKQTDINYEEFFKVSDEFIEEIIDIMPYKVIKHNDAEADDIIGILAHYLKNKNIIITSRDKDFKQLLKFSNITLYDPVTKKFLTSEDPYLFLIDHIVRGDSSDGIPNIFSDDNTFVDSSKRQKRITKKIIDEVFENGLEKFVVNNNLIKNYERNRKLIELSEETIPQEIWNDVIFKYNNIEPEKNYIKIIKFLRKHKIRSLIDKADKFLY